MLKEKLKRVWRKLKQSVLIWLGLLSGCATTPPPCAPVSMTLPEPPALTQPLPSTGYLEPALRNIEAWRSRLNAMPTTSEPAAKPGPE
jgi:hypothetical protein